MPLTRESRTHMHMCSSYAVNSIIIFRISDRRLGNEEGPGNQKRDLLDFFVVATNVCIRYLGGDFC